LREVQFIARARDAAKARHGLEDDKLGKQSMAEVAAQRTA
jgi:hypothetical protein